MATFAALTTAFLLVAALAAPARAQPDRGASAFNWYYATAFGTGIYRVGSVDVITLKLPFAHSLRPATPDQWGVKLLLPVTVGGADTNAGSGISGVPDRLASAAVVPGIEFERQLGPDWTIKPYFNAGVGREFLEGSTAEILIAGVKSRYRLPLENRDAYLGNALVYSRTWVDHGNDDTLGVFVAGLNAAAFDGPEIGARATKVWGHAIYYGYFNDLEFVLPGTEVVALRNEFELAVSLTPRKAWDILGFDLEVVGLGYRFSDDTKGITLFTSLPF